MILSSNQVECGFLLPTAKWLIKKLSHLSLYDLLRRKVWKHHELIPFWVVESYVLGWVILSFAGLVSVSVNHYFYLWILSILAVYRLFDLIIGFGRIIFVEREHRQDKQGHYLLVRDVGRWVIITFLHLLEITFCFGILYLKIGQGFEKKISDWITAIYQSSLTFTTLGYGEIHAQSPAAKILVIVHLFYFMAFVLFIIPFIFSAVRAKERTTEDFGKTDIPDS